jgi:hypothetical protein
MDINEMRRWFEQERLKARERLHCHLENGERELKAGHRHLAFWELCWAREIRNDWKLFDVKF